MSETTLRLDRPLKMVTICLGQMQTNCYIVENTKTNQAFVFDPGDQGERIMDILKEDGMELAGVCLTHGHFDHILAAQAVKEKYNIPIYACRQEEEMLREPSINMTVHYGQGCSIVPDVFLEDLDVIRLAGFSVQMIHTPGHTQGGVCYYVEKEGVLFSGDTLFCCSVGRSDFATSSTSALIRSIKEKLFLLPDETKVFPGHMGATTIGNEKVNNPYV